MIAAALGIASISVFPELPPPFVAWAALPLIVLWRLYPRATGTPLIFLILGMLWGIHYGHALLEQRFPRQYEAIDLWVDGKVTGLPVHSQRRGEPVQRFDFKLESGLCPAVVEQGQCIAGVKQLRLSWYGQDALQPGQRWHLRVRLKRPHATANPAGFDYQSWLIQQGIDAVGYVRDDPGNQLLAGQQLTVDGLRWSFSASMDKQLEELPYLPILKALLIADMRAISPQQWQMFARTGTTHLMVISGLHVSLIALLVFHLCRWLSIICCPWLAAERCAAVCSVGAAVVYSVAAGFSLPTQRALLMLVVWMTCIFFRRHLAPSQGLVMALLLCLLFDPLAPIGLSFWLSFVAVAVIFYGSVGRRQQRSGPDLGYLAQYLVFIGMIPVLALLLGKVSLLSPLANLLAVPAFNLLIVPFNLLAALLVGVNNDIAVALWQLLDRLIHYAFYYLQLLDQCFPTGVLVIAEVPLLAKLLAILGALLVLLPRGMPLRASGLLLLLPLFFLKPLPPKYGDVVVTVLDVGQGLSVVVQTHHHRLVYDLGPAYSDEFDTATTVVLPYLQSRGIDRIDRLVLSHGDNDHAGGWQALLAELPVQSLYYGEYLNGFDVRARPCMAGQRWQWEGVAFEFLHPRRGVSYGKSNNYSCVLKVTAGKVSFLLPGDIEESVELTLLRSNRRQLAATVLLAPHHGSSTSSSWAFLKQVAPEQVVFSSGYHNSFGHPQPAIELRYRQGGSLIHSTRDHGAITFKTVAGELFSPTHFRQQHPRYWR
jgi:competence protein ComEC